MNEIIGELSNIEESTSGIIEAANAKKKELAAQMDQKTKLWDKELAEQTQQKIQKLRTEMQNTISKNLAEQKAKSEAKQTLEVKEAKKELTQVASEAEVTNKLAETELAKADVKEENKAAVTAAVAKNQAVLAETKTLLADTSVTKEQVDAQLERLNESILAVYNELKKDGKL